MDKIGQGLFSAVYKSNNTAIKIVDAEFLKPPHSVKAEIKALQSLAHPNVVKLLDVQHVTGMDPEVHLIFPLYGCTLQHYLFAHSKAAWPKGWRCTLELPTAASIAGQVASGLAHIHSKGIIHRDIKPENILMENDMPVICDFGIAWVPGLGEEPMVCDVATAGYKAPELLLGRDYDSAVDVWALGVLLALLASRDCTGIFGEYSGDIALLSMQLCVLGPPPPEWNVAFEASQNLGAKFDALRGLQDVIKEVLSWRPQSRPTAKQLETMLQNVC